MINHNKGRNKLNKTEPLLHLIKYHLADCISLIGKEQMICEHIVIAENL